MDAGGHGCDALGFRYALLESPDTLRYLIGKNELIFNKKNEAAPVKHVPGADSPLIPLLFFLLFGVLRID